MDTYKHVSCGPLTEAQKRKVLKTGKITFTAAQVSGSGKKVALHPESHKKWQKAKVANKGLSITFTPGEVAASLAMHGDALEGSGMEGGSLWSWVKDKAWPWLKKNYDVIKPVLSRVADTAVPALATALGQPSLAVPARGALQQLTGVGVKPKKGSPEMAAKMAALRAKRKTGGSFRL